MELIKLLVVKEEEEDEKRQMCVYFCVKLGIITLAEIKLWTG